MHFIHDLVMFVVGLSERSLIIRFQKDSCDQNDVLHKPRQPKIGFHDHVLVIYVARFLTTSIYVARFLTTSKFLFVWTSGRAARHY